MNTVAAILLAIGVSFLISFLLGFVVIPFLRKLHFGQTILEIGPAWHKSKQGTPTMGGFMFIISTVVSFAAVILGDYLLGGNLFASGSFIPESIKVKLLSGIIMALGFGIIGFADDYIKVVKKRNLGLTITQKSVAQIVLMLAYLGSLYMSGNTYMSIPFVGNVDLGWFFWFFGMAVIYATVNAVNFTDGVDGLCSSVTSVAAIAFIIAAALKGLFGVSILAGALLGGCLGYLIWNWNPSKVMMGDTGSMFLGGMVVALASASFMCLKCCPMFYRLVISRQPTANAFSKWRRFIIILKCAAGKKRKLLLYFRLSIFWAAPSALRCFITA